MRWVLADSRVESVHHRHAGVSLEPQGPRAISGSLASACRCVGLRCPALAGTGTFQGLPAQGHDLDPQHGPLGNHICGQDGAGTQRLPSESSPLGQRPSALGQRRVHVSVCVRGLLVEIKGIDPGPLGGFELGLLAPCYFSPGKGWESSDPGSVPAQGPWARISLSLPSVRWGGLSHAISQASRALQL